MAGQIGHPKGTEHRIQVFQELGPVGQVLVLPCLLCAHPGEEDVQQAPGIVEEGNGAVAGPGEGPGRVQHPLEHGVEVQILGNPEAGLAQAGEALPQGRYLQVSLL